MKIRFSKRAWDDVTEIVRISDKEVGMMGLVEFIPKTKTYYISDIFVPKQEVSSVTTDLDADSMAQLENTIFEGQQTGIYPIKANLNAWIHSHVNMGVHWSGTDNDTIREMAHYGQDREGLCVAVVVNKKGETRGAVCYNSGSNSSYVPSVFVDDIDVEYDYIPSLSANWATTLKEMVREKSTIYSGYIGNSGRGSWMNDSDDWWETRKKYMKEEAEKTAGKSKGEKVDGDVNTKPQTSLLSVPELEKIKDEPVYLGKGDLVLSFNDYELCMFDSLEELEMELTTLADYDSLRCTPDEYDYWIDRWRWINGA